ncbi:hypothetical protein TEK04_14960 [Klenkia sp. LSe6-5]|uniref:Uncharacterized protein n=1 Tax=Klenkia sesuvii TaxID=3103137 RepID=A0ABU8DW34_9ACTN
MTGTVAWVGTTHRSRTWAAALLLALCSGSAAACGPAGITADTSCADYISAPQGERWDAAVRISSELGVQGGGNPMWGPNTDYVCGSNRDMTVGDAIG